MEAMTTFRDYLTEFDNLETRIHQVGYLAMKLGCGKDNDGAGFFKGFGTFLSKNTVYTGRYAIGCDRFLLL